MQNARRGPPTRQDSWMKREKNTIPHLLFNYLENLNHRHCIGSKFGYRFEYLTYREFHDLVRSFGCALLAAREQGLLNPKCNVAILSENSIEWIVADFGSMAAGMPSVPLYSILTAEQVAHVLLDSKAEVLFISNQEQYDKVQKIAASIPTLKLLIVHDEHVLFDSNLPFKCVYYKDFMKLEKNEKTKLLDLLKDAINAQKPDDTCTIIYTSGTTSDPKGVMLSHRAALFSSCSSIHLRFVEGLRKRDWPRLLLFLPLSHVFARLEMISVLVCTGGTVSLAESIDKVSQNLLEVRPNIFASVPRLYEKIYHKIHERLDEAGFIKKNLFNWANFVGRRYHDYVGSQEKIPKSLAVQYKLAERLVYSKLRDLFGGKVTTMYSGGAKLPINVMEFFASNGILISEAYGMTEHPVISCNRLTSIRRGSVGQPLREVQISIAPDGEVLVKSTAMMKGYFNRPDDTALVIDEEGWLHTGDLGELDKDGYLRINGRKKEMIVLSNGQKIFPVHIEDMILRMRMINQIVIVGEGRDNLTALVTLNKEVARLALEAKGISLQDRQRVLKYIESEIHETCLGYVTPYEEVKRITILDRSFDLEHNEITPTMRPRRGVIEKNFKDEIEAMYAEAAVRRIAVA